MKHIVEFSSDDGNTVLVEIEAYPADEAAVKASTFEGVIAKANMSLEQAIDQIKPVAGLLSRNYEV